MPGLLNSSSPARSPPPPAGSSGIWSKKRDVITFDHLQKFWSELPLQARQELLRIDKQTLFEQARKNLYCSRCNGLLLEGFSQIVMYGKSLQQEGTGFHLPNRTRAVSMALADSESDDVQDPSVHPWGGLAATRDGILTLVDCFINARSLKPLQNVFDSARAREHERELLYPDACGGGGRGWISQGMTNYGRGHGTRDTCALHTARLSCDTLVDFWSALGEETRTSLLQMKEEDFIERLMYRFDSKRFCRDCRRKVIREFKELKELKRMRRELRCTSWFCVADTAFQYEVSQDMVQADWHQSFTDSIGTYHHFEWAIGTGEGKYDILEFEDVGMSGKVQANGLDLGGLSSCVITLRAWKLDGRCTELCVKAHALKGQACVHRRLMIGDGFVTITKGESIRRFFEHAEEAEEEEDDDTMDKDGNELDGDGSRPQKHAKSPELAREFLLDAATVIFKEQVEKAFGEGTARQNAHSLFVSLALNLLEERVHVACKEIITLEKQIKLLEEEEKEKREEEERRERRRTKEREKKLRRKERLKGKEREREKKNNKTTPLYASLPASANDSPASTAGDSSPTTVESGDSISDPGDIITPTRPMSPDMKDELSSNGCVDTNSLKSDNIQDNCHIDGEFSVRDSASFILEQSKSSRRKLRFKKDSHTGLAAKWYDDTVHHGESDSKLVSGSRLMNGGHRLLRERGVKNARNCNSKFSEKFHCSSTRLRGYEFQSCSCSPNGDYRKDSGYNLSTIKSGREMKYSTKSEPTGDMSRSLYRGSKYNQGRFIPENCALPKGKVATGTPSRDVIHTKQVWEPMDTRRKGNRSNSDPDCTMRSVDVAEQTGEAEVGKAASECSSEIPGDVGKDGTLSNYEGREEDRKNPCSVFVSVTKSDCYSKDDEDSCFPTGNKCGDPVPSSSSSDSCSSCLSEGDGSISSSSAQNTESSSTSDSEDASPQSEGRVDTSSNKYKTNLGSSLTRPSTEFSMASCVAHVPREERGNTANFFDGGGYEFDMFPRQHRLPIHGQNIHMPVFPPSTVGYHNPAPVSWPATPASGLMQFPQTCHFLFPPSTLGYALPAARPSEFGMQYNSLQAATPPLYNTHHHYMYQTGNRANPPNPKEQSRRSSVCELTTNGNRLERSTPKRQLPSKPPSSGHTSSVGNASRPRDDFSSFSLFHFGGPVAVAAGQNASSVSRKEETTGRMVPSLASAPRADTSSKENMPVEEYSLFAAGNGAMFSFF
ncbi:uncharacterized protein M6B38_161760 [Iris pallida]|uniref:Uncharacterized protein n=1 Tax=Iris pallida TaxID=29817 RepID=A0AAX6EZC4_IRIPA|nr:uncharacterized protein M6B38_161760 [Iris pallida]